MKIYDLGFIPEDIYPNIGGKARGLDLLIKNKFNVPKGFLITDIGEIEEDEIYRAFDEHNFTTVSVRSSATLEDSKDISNAGQFDTFLFVKRDNLIESIHKCIESLDSLRVLKYNEHFNMDGSNSMNIIVEEMVDSKKAGVFFTSNPRNGSSVLIEAVKNQGENLVSGKNSAHQYELSKKQYIDKSDDLLSKEELKKIYDIALRIKDTFKEEMDVEWAINNKLYILQMRPITTTIIDLEEFDRCDNLDDHLFTKRNVGEMMPGAVTPLTLSTSAKAIDYGMRYMLKKAGLYKKVDDIEPLRLISSFSGHLFFDMQLLYELYTKVAIANPQSMNLSIMGEYHDYPPIKKKNACKLVRLINSIKFLKYVFSGKKAMKKFDSMLKKVSFKNTSDFKELYNSIDYNLRYLDESLIYHYASSSYSGSATSTLYMMLDKYFTDKKEYQAFLSKILSNIPNIESADILKRLQEIAILISKKNDNAKSFDELELLEFIRSDEEISALYQEFLEKHGHRTIKEAELRNKSWRKDETSLMNYLRSIINSEMNMTENRGEINLKQEFKFIKKPLLRLMSISYAKKSREAVVNREYTKSRLIKIIDYFKSEYELLSKLLVKNNLLVDEDQIYFLTHEEIGELIKGNSSLLSKANLRREALKIQEELSFDDIYIGRPIPNQSTDLSSGTLKGVPISVGECEGYVHIVKSVDDANKIKKEEIMVAKFTDIGWTPYYSKIKGLITEIGSSLSHGAVVAREYNLPTIVNVKGATKALKNGDHIMMDATKGTITIIE